jgi:electron transfer flavoprotein alpha subunit
MLSDYAPEAIAEALAQLVGAEMPSAVVATGTERAAEVMAHLAALLDLPLAANVLTIDASEDEWTLSRVRWGGSLIEDARLAGFVKLVTIAPHSQPAYIGSSETEITVFNPELDESLARTRVTERVTVDAGITLTTAPVVISGGRGVGSAEGFAVLEELADLLGGAVGCSRVVTNNGWRSHRDQVGQTGTRIAPNLYVACGISGAIQHWVGMMAAKKVLAINTDPQAPMVMKSDYSVIGDLHEVLPAIVTEVKRRKGLA